MKVAGDLAHFSLADLIQVHSLSGRSCTVKVLGPDGQGALSLLSGQLVHAAYEDLTGMDALVAVLALGQGYFQVEPGEPAAERSLEGSLSKLLMSANERIKAGDVPRPKRVTAPASPPRDTAAAGRAVAAAGSAAGPAPGAAAPTRPGGGQGIALVALALVAVLSIIWFAFSRLSHNAAHPPASSSGVSGVSGVAGGSGGSGVTGDGSGLQAVEATSLTGPGDLRPSLLTGGPAVSPDPSAALKPTIVVRLLITAEGKVAEARIYRSRLDLAMFEDAAVSAAQGYRFTPARRGRRPVPVWINWPVSFR